MVPMIQRMMKEATLGEQEKLRLLLITLISYPSLLGSPEWERLVHAASLHIEEYILALSAGEYVAWAASHIDE